MGLRPQFVATLMLLLGGLLAMSAGLVYAQLCADQPERARRAFWYLTTLALAMLGSAWVLSSTPVP